ncbi:FlgK family flagellar hook-associated protein [Parvularcula dongshanensis]|uniref:Flagellar hook-associated protein 1 n=1 Tax=Parvularcula dongshanensis TaxID=1173995 RepID=A0A840I3N5_9PROT|nr:flagellar basal body rod C-terminal domain-containing protein [Parvularcula dongshanensis]MBB4659616.1 flagellar hook-associated protein 1 FlgK [Parvularcula dongshanensis]
MTVSAALNIATSGLAAARARADVAAGNVANAHTEGYVRRAAALSERVIGTQGAGVRLLGETRAGASHLTTERMRADALASSASSGAEAARRLTELFGGPNDETGVLAALADFERSLRDAAATPESETLLLGLRDAGQALTTRLGEASEGADAMRSEADRDIGIAVVEINDALTRLEALNRLPAGETTPAVEDERQRLIDGINADLPVTVLRQGDDVHLVTEGGAFLLTSTAHTVEFTPMGSVGRTHALGAPLSGISVDGVDLTPTGTGPQRSSSGRIAALFSQRDGEVPAFQDALDEVAVDLVTRFAADESDPTKTPGEAGLFTDGGDPSPSGLGAGIAGRLRLAAAVDPAQGGTVTRLRDGLGAAATGPIGNGDQLGRFLSTLTADGGPAVRASALSADQGAKLQSAEGRSVAAAIRQRGASDAEIGALGVDTDKELQDMMLIEQAYAANARVLQTVSDMMDVLMAAVR